MHYIKYLTGKQQFIQLQKKNEDILMKIWQQSIASYISTQIYIQLV